MCDAAVHVHLPMRLSSAPERTLLPCSAKDSLMGKAKEVRDSGCLEHLLTLSMHPIRPWTRCARRLLIILMPLFVHLEPVMHVLLGHRWSVA